MIAFLCAALTAVGFYFSAGLGDQWWLAWLAPIPILWLAFGDAKGWQVSLAAFLAYALGETSILRAYGGVMPVPVLFIAIGGPALCFVLAVSGARRIQRRFGDIAGMFGFAALWAAVDFLSSFSNAGGAVATPAAAEVGAPMLIQSASLVGFIGITFLLGLVSAGLALTLRKRTALPAVIAIAVFALNAGFGYWRMSQPAEETMHVALIDSDSVTGGVRKEDKAATMKAIDAYAAEIEKLRDSKVSLIVLPENIAMLGPEWRGEAEAKLAAAVQGTNTTLVAGFNTALDGAQRNVSLGYTPGATEPVIYQKRRLVKGLETQYYTPGPGPKVLPNGIGLEICKDMDFHAMVRDDEVATQPKLLAVPAWDFGTDDWSHARVAILRSVENGVPMARSAREGLLTLNDRYGRLLAIKKNGSDFSTMTGELPLDGRGGNTVYDRIGDAFGWLCAIIGAGLFAFSFWPRNRDVA
jgi:apolipoprotein N-acyltransferase